MVVLKHLLITALGLFRAGRYRWLQRYLKGVGGEVTLTKDSICWRSIANAVILQQIRTGRVGELSGRYCLDSSIIYPGSGFVDRPEMFYQVGGFTFDLVVEGGLVHLHAEDVYDWHPRGDGGYHWSPVSPIIARIIGLFVRDRRLVNLRDGISNQLWERMADVGAQPFTTLIRGAIERESLEDLLLNAIPEEFELPEATEREIHQDIPEYWAYSVFEDM